MIPRLSDSLVLQPRDVEPSQPGWEVIGVFNPAVVKVGNDQVMFARVAERPAEHRPGWTALPHWSTAGIAEVEWVCNDDLQPSDARVVKRKCTGDLRLTSVSHLQIRRVSNLHEIAAVVLPAEPYEEYGIEDPRVSKIDETYWVTYVAVSRWGAATALLSSPDLITFKRHGIIFPSENKDVVLFPEKLSGDFVALHRPNPNSHFSPPRIWIARSPDLIHWGRHKAIVNGKQPWESDRIGSGTPPIRIDEGWLTLYHGSAKSDVAGTVGAYAAGALLLDRDDPSCVIGRSREPIMLPMTDYETKGFVPNVVFPTAMLNYGDDLEVFYGAADACVGHTRFSKRTLLESLW